MRKKEINIAINSIAATMIHSGSEDTTHAEVSFLTRGLCSQIKEDEEEEEASYSERGREGEAVEHGDGVVARRNSWMAVSSLGRKQFTTA